MKLTMSKRSGTSSSPDNMKAGGGSGLGFRWGLHCLVGVLVVLLAVAAGFASSHGLAPFFSTKFSKVRPFVPSWITKSFCPMMRSLSSFTPWFPTSSLLAVDLGDGAASPPSSADSKKSGIHGNGRLPSGTKPSPVSLQDRADKEGYRDSDSETQALRSPSSTSSIFQTQNLTLPVLWMAPFFAGGGYCSEAIAYILAMHRTGRADKIRIAAHGDGVSREFVSGMPLEMRAILQEMLWTNTDMDVGEAIVVCHSEPGAWHPPLFQTTPCPPFGWEEGMRPKFVIGRTMFETDRVSPAHVERCNRMDEVWVPADFHLATFADSGVEAAKLQKLIQPVDVTFFDPHKHPAMALEYGLKLTGPSSSSSSSSYGKGRTSPSPTAPLFLKHDRPRVIFISIFKWEERKGWDILVRSFLEEFSADDSVLLYIHTSSYHSDSNFGKKIRAFINELALDKGAENLAAIHVHSRHVELEKLPGLYMAADVFVLPSRGEGWGRPHVEAMAMGVPIIATNWSGITEYLREENGYPFPYDGLREVHEGAFKGHMWAEPSVRELRHLMRMAAEDDEGRRMKGRRAREDMVNKFSMEVVGDVLLKHFLRVEEEVRRRDDQAS